MAFGSLSHLLAASRNPMHQQKVPTSVQARQQLALGDIDGAINSLAQTESGGNWAAQNQEVGAGGHRGHVGRLQFGKARLDDFSREHGIGSIDPEVFKSDPDLQKMVERWHFQDIDKFINERGLAQYEGQNIGGTPITRQSMYAVAHLGGKGGLEKFLKSGGAYNPSDTYGTSLSDYAKRHAGVEPDVAAAIDAGSTFQALDAQPRSGASRPLFEDPFGSAGPAAPDVEDDSWLADFGANVANIGGRLFGLGASLDQASTLPVTPEGWVNAALGIEETDFRRSVEDYLTSFDVSPDEDIAPAALWQQAKEGRIGELTVNALELFFVNSPWMITAMMGMPGFIAASAAMTEQLAIERAQNDGRDTPTAGDLVIGAVAAVPSMALERFGGRTLIGQGVGKRVAALGGGSAAGRIGVAAGVEAGTEAIEEGGQYLATTVGTQTPPTAGGFGEAVFAGALGGGVGGAAVRGGVETHRALRRDVDQDLAAALQPSPDFIGSGRYTAAQGPQVPESADQAFGPVIQERGAAPTSMEEGYLEQPAPPPPPVRPDFSGAGITQLEPRFSEVEDPANALIERQRTERAATPRGEQQPLFAAEETPEALAEDQIRQQMRVLRRATPKQLRRILEEYGASTGGTRKELLARAREVLATQLQETTQEPVTADLFDPETIDRVERSTALAQLGPDARRPVDWARAHVASMPTTDKRGRTDPERVQQKRDVLQALNVLEQSDVALEALAAFANPMHRGQAARAAIDQRVRSFRRKMLEEFTPPGARPRDAEERRTLVKNAIAAIGREGRAGLTDGRLASVDEEGMPWKRRLRNATGAALAGLREIERYYGEKARRDLAAFADEQAKKHAAERLNKAAKARKSGTTAREEYDAEQKRIVDAIMKVGDAIIEQEENATMLAARNLADMSDGLSEENYAKVAKAWPGAYADIGALDPNLAMALREAITGDNPQEAVKTAEFQAAAFLADMKEAFDIVEEKEPVSPPTELRKGSSAWTDLKEKLESAIDNMPYPPSEWEVAGELAEQRDLLDQIHGDVSVAQLEDLKGLSEAAAKSYFMGDRVASFRVAETGERIEETLASTPLGRLIVAFDEASYGDVVRRLRDLAEQAIVEEQKAEAGEVAPTPQDPIPTILHLLSLDERPAADAVRKRIGTKYGFQVKTGKNSKRLQLLKDPKELRALADELESFGYADVVNRLVELEGDPAIVDYLQQVAIDDPTARTLILQHLPPKRGWLEEPVEAGTLEKLLQVRHTLTPTDIRALVDLKKQDLGEFRNKILREAVDPLAPKLRRAVEIYREYKDDPKLGPQVSGLLTNAMLVEGLRKTGYYSEDELVGAVSLRFEERLNRWKNAQKKRSERSTIEKAEKFATGPEAITAASKTGKLIAFQQRGQRRAPSVPQPREDMSVQQLREIAKEINKIAAHKAGKGAKPRVNIRLGKAKLFQQASSAYLDLGLDLSQRDADVDFGNRVNTFDMAIRRDPNWEQVPDELKGELRRLAAALDEDIETKYVDGYTETPLPREQVVEAARDIVRNIYAAQDAKISDAQLTREASFLADDLLDVAFRANAFDRQARAADKRKARRRNYDEYRNDLRAWEAEQEAHQKAVATGETPPPLRAKPVWNPRYADDQFRSASVMQNWAAAGNQAYTYKDVQKRGGKEGETVRIDRQKFAPEYGEERDLSFEPEAKARAEALIPQPPRKASRTEHRDFWRAAARRQLDEALGERIDATLIPQSMLPKESMTVAQLRALAREYNEILTQYKRDKIKLSGRKQDLIGRMYAASAIPAPIATPAGRKQIYRAMNILLNNRSSKNVNALITGMRQHGVPSRVLNAILDTVIEIAGSKVPTLFRKSVREGTAPKKAKLTSRSVNSKRARLANLVARTGKSPMELAIERSYTPTKEKPKRERLSVGDIQLEVGSEFYEAEKFMREERRAARDRSPRLSDEDTLPFIGRQNTAKVDKKLRTALQASVGRELPVDKLLEFLGDNVPRALRPIAKKLARLPLKTRVVVAPFGEMPTVEGGPVLGNYNTETDTIVLSDIAGAHIAIHELTHAATAWVLMHNPELARRVQTLMRRVQRARPDLIHIGGPRNWGMRNELEFIAEAHSNLEFQHALKNIRMDDGDVSGWRRFLDTIRNVLGLGVSRSVMNEVLSLDNQLLQPGGAFVAPEVLNMVATAGHPALARAAGKMQAMVDQAQDVWSTRKLRTRFKDPEFSSQTLMQLARHYEPYFMDGPRSLLRDAIEAVGKKWVKAHQHLQQGRHLYNRLMSYSPQDPKLVKALDDVMAYATLFAVDPSKSEAEQPRNKFNKHAHARAKTAYEKLDAEGKKLFQDTRDYYETEWKKTINAIVSNRVILDGTNVDGDVVRRAVAQMMTEPDEVKRQTIRDNLVEEVRKRGANEPEGRIDGLLIAIDKAAEAIDHKHRSYGVYFPLRRFGEYVLEWNGTFRRLGISKDEMDRMLAEEPALSVSEWRKADKTTYDVTFRLRVFDMYEDPAEAMRGKESGDRLWKELQAKYGDVKTVFNGELDAIKNQHLHPGDSAARLFEQLEARKKEGLITDDELEHMRQAIYRMLPATSVNTAFQRRENVAMLHNDMRKSFAAHLQSSAFWLAQMEEGRDAAKALQALDTFLTDRKKQGKSVPFERRLVNFLRDTDRAGQVHREPSTFQRIVLNTAVANYLFGLSYSMVNAMQNYVVLAPYLNAKFGAGATYREMARAHEILFPAAAQNIANTKGGLSLFNKRVHERSDALNSIADNAIERLVKTFQADPQLKGSLPELLEIIKSVEDLGLVDFTHAMEVRLAAQGVGEGKFGGALQAVMDVGRALPQTVEVNNRLITVLSTYMLMKQDGKQRNFTELRRGVTDALEITQIAYMPWNTPRYLSEEGPIGRLAPYIGLFIKYGQGIYSLMGEAMHSALAGQDRATQKEGWKMFAGLVATHAITAGVTGGLLLQPLRLLLWTVAQLAADDDDPDDWLHDIDTYMMNLFSGWMGPDLGEAVTYGLPRALGIDLSSRINLSQLIGGFWNQGRTPEDSFQNFMFAHLGPVVALGPQVIRAGQAFGNGEIAKGIGNLPLPKAIRDASKAFALATNGLTKRSGASIAPAEDFGMGSIIAQGVGFTPSAVARTYERRTAILGRKERTEARASAIRNEFAMAETAAERAAAVEKMRAFNRNNRYRIKMSSMLERRRELRKSERMAAEGHPTTSRRDVRLYEEGLNF